MTSTAEMAVERVGINAAPPAHPGGGPVCGGHAEPLTDEAEIWHALVLGLRDYVEKNGFRLGGAGPVRRHRLRGGGRDRRGRARGRSGWSASPCPASTPPEHSRDDAADLAKRTGLDYRVEPIQEMVDAFLTNLSLSGLAVENLQARVRGVILMALSNQEGHLVLTTGNKSELAVGYSTLYGDSVGGFNPLKDVLKTLVWKLAQWRNAEADAARRDPADPGELDHQAAERGAAPGPARHRLAARLRRAGRRSWPATSTATWAATTWSRPATTPRVVDRVLRLVDIAEYKRRQSAPGTKISIKAFGRDRRLPITNRFREGAARATV